MAVTLAALILPLGLDTFAVAAALGAVGNAATDRIRIAVLFAAFEGGMPVIGLALGAPLGRAIGPAAEGLAIAILVAFGAVTLVTSDDDHVRLEKFVRTRGAGTVALGLSISLDELAIGFTIGLLRVPAGLVVVLIALQAFLLAQLGLRVGARLSERAREGTERLAGVVLIVLGLALLGERLLA